MKTIVTPPNNLTPEQYAHITNPGNRDTVKQRTKDVLTNPEATVINRANAIAVDAYRRRAGQTMAKTLLHIANGNSTNPLQRSVDNAFRVVRLRNGTAGERTPLNISINSPYSRQSRWRPTSTSPSVPVKHVVDAAALAKTIYDLSLTNVRHQVDYDGRLLLTLGSRDEVQDLQVEDAKVVAKKLMLPEGHVAGLDFGGTRIDNRALDKLLPALCVAIGNGTLKAIDLRGIEFDSAQTEERFMSALADALGKPNNLEALEVPQGEAGTNLLIHAMGSEHSRLQRVSLKDGVRISPDQAPLLETALFNAISGGHLQRLTIGGIAINNRDYVHMLELMRQALAGPNHIKELNLPLDDNNIDLLLAALEHPAPELESACLEACDIQDDEADRLTPALARSVYHGTMQRIDMETALMSDEKFDDMTGNLARALQPDGNSNLSSLFLPQLPANMEHVLDILDASQGKLKAFTVAVPPMSKDTAKTFGLSVRNTGLTELRVHTYAEREEDIPPHQDGVRSFVRTLPEATEGANAQLKRLALQCTLEDRDLRTLGDIVASPYSVLTHLSLAGCHASEHGLVDLISRIAPQGALRVLDLAGFPRSEVLTQAIDEARTRCPNLTIKE